MKTHSSMIEALADIARNIRVCPARSLDRQLDFLLLRPSQSVFISKESGADFASRLERHWQQTGLNFIPVECRKRLGSPFEMVRSLIGQLQTLRSERAAALEAKYSEVLSLFRHHRLKPYPQSRFRLDVAPEDLIVGAEPEISNDATIGLMREAINYTLEFFSEDDAPALVFIDDIENSDRWSASFLAHLTRKVTGRPLVVCAACGPRPGASIRYLLDKGALISMRLEGVSASPDLIRSRFRRLSPERQMLLGCLATLDSPASREEMGFVLSEDLSSVEAAVEELIEERIIGETTRDEQATYFIRDSIWKSIARDALPLARRRQYHLLASRLLIRSIADTQAWEASEKINAIYFHLMRSGDWMRVIEYDSVYYSCPVNTLLPHVQDNLKALGEIVTAETVSGRAVRERIAYQRASDTVRMAGDADEKIRTCERYLNIGSDAYSRAEVYANLVVLHANRRKETSLQEAAVCADKADREIESISDPALLQHIVAIVNNAKALIFFKLNEARRAIEMEEEALRLLKEAPPLKNRPTVSIEAVAGSLAQIYSRLLDDYETANRIYLDLLDDARALTRPESEAASLIAIGKNLHSHKRYGEALGYFLSSAEAASQSYRTFTARMYALKAAGLCYFHLGDYDSSTRSLESCLALAADVGELSEIAGLLASIGQNFRHTGQAAEAAALYHRALRLSRLSGAKRQAALYSTHLGMLQAEMKEFKKSARFFGQASRLYFASGEIENALKFCEAALNCYRLVKSPCDAKTISHIVRIAQIEKPLRGDFLEALLEQAAMLRQRGREKEADMLMAVGGPEAARSRTAQTI
jgi:tetratricopeptide (TPR) repeat protein